MSKTNRSKAYAKSAKRHEATIKGERPPIDNDAAWAELMAMVEDRLGPTYPVDNEVKRMSRPIGSVCLAPDDEGNWCQADRPCAEHSTYPVDSEVTA